MKIFKRIKLEAIRLLMTLEELGNMKYIKQAEEGIKAGRTRSLHDIINDTQKE